MKVRRALHVLFAVFVVAGAFGTAAPAQDLTDREILEELYDRTDGANWADSTNWKSSARLNDWYGVRASGDTVTRLDLEANGLDGTLPASLGGLSGLTMLSLKENSLSGSIPSELGNLAELQRLWLSRNDFGGSIPPELGNLTNLRHLGLGANQLSGSIPPELGNLTELRQMWLRGNQLSGSIPPELGNLPNLRIFGLSANSLSATIPPELGNLTASTRIGLRLNQLTGVIPPELGNLSDLEELWLDGNQLTGSIPPELGNLSDVQEMVLGDNQLSGSIPPELGKLTDVRQLQMDDNQLSGSIPSELRDLDNLDSGGLQLAGNDLDGAIPHALTEFAPSINPQRSAGNLPVAPPAGITLTVTSLTVQEGAWTTIEVALVNEPAEAVVVSASSSDTGVATVFPDSRLFPVSDWDTARTFTVRAVGDDDAHDESASIELTSSGDDGISRVSVTVQDDDAAGAGLTLTGVPVTVDEGGTATFTVVLAAEPKGDVTVRVSSSLPGTAAATGPLTFTTANWDTAQTVTVTAEHDDDWEDESVTLTLSSTGGGYDVVRSMQVSVTVKDDGGENDSDGGDSDGGEDDSDGGEDDSGDSDGGDPDDPDGDSDDSGDSDGGGSDGDDSDGGEDDSGEVEEAAGLSLPLDPIVLEEGGKMTVPVALSAPPTGSATEEAAQVGLVAAAARAVASVASVTLSAAPAATEKVTVAVRSADPSVARVSPSALVFDATNWDKPQPVTVAAVAPGETSVVFDPSGGGYDELPHTACSVTVTGVTPPPTPVPALPPLGAAALFLLLAVRGMRAQRGAA